MKVPERGTPFTDRISVNGTGASGEVVLTINNVQLADELEFICLVKSLTEGAGEGRTRLKVFGKIQFELIISRLHLKFDFCSRNFLSAIESKIKNLVPRASRVKPRHIMQWKRGRC